MGAASRCACSTAPPRPSEEDEDEDEEEWETDEDEGEDEAEEQQGGPAEVDEAQLRELLAAGAAKHGAAGAIGDASKSDRPDAAARVARARSFLARGELPPPVACCDPLVSPEAVEASPTLRVLASMRPTCQGDGVADLRRFANRLRGRAREREHRLGLRLSEWFVSGLCEACQRAYMEG